MRLYALGSEKHAALQLHLHRVADQGIQIDLAAACRRIHQKTAEEERQIHGLICLNACGLFPAAAELKPLAENRPANGQPELFSQAVRQQKAAALEGAAGVNRKLQGNVREQDAVLWRNRQGAA